MIFQRKPKDKAPKRPRKQHRCEYCDELLSSESRHYRCPYRDSGTDTQNKEDEHHSSELSSTHVSGK